MKYQSTLLLLTLYMTGQANSASISQADAQKIMQKSGCIACHAIDKTVLGPSYKDVAKRYKNPDKATLAYLKGQSPLEYLKAKVRTGTKMGVNKNWIKSPEGKPYAMMTPNPPTRIADDQLIKLIEYILSLE